MWRAEDRSLNIEVAIKLIEPALVESPLAMARFEQEAHAAARLRSTHIVHINDYGIDDASGQPYIAMDLLEGESLQQRMDREGRLPFSEVQHILAQVAQGLELAHSKGIVHRDLKPENIFLAREGGKEVVKLLDFGIAKRLDKRETSALLRTGDGQVLGTPYYMSPEQAKAMSTVDHRTDIWAFGVIAFEAATGIRPFEGDNLTVLIQSICGKNQRDPADFVAVPNGFSNWFARAAARECDQRFQSIAAAAEALAALKGAPLVSRSRSESGARTLDVAVASSNSDVTMSSSDVAVRHGWLSKRHVSLWAAAFSVLGIAAGAWWLSRSSLEPVASTVITANPGSSVAQSADVPRIASSSSIGAAILSSAQAARAMDSASALETSTERAARSVERQPSTKPTPGKKPRHVRAPKPSEQVLDPGI